MSTRLLFFLVAPGLLMGLTVGVLNALEASEQMAVSVLALLAVACGTLIGVFAERSP